jgi:hypothetical protein
MTPRSAADALRPVLDFDAHALTESQHMPNSTDNESPGYYEADRPRAPAQAEHGSCDFRINRDSAEACNDAKKGDNRRSVN